MMSAKFKAQSILISALCLIVAVALAELFMEASAHAENPVVQVSEPYVAIIGSSETIIALAEPGNPTIDVTPQLALAPITLGNRVMAKNRPMTLAALPPETTEDTAKGFNPKAFEKSVTIRKGDSIGRVLIKAGAEPRAADEAVKALRRLYDPRNLKIGQDIAIRFRPIITGPEDLGLEKPRFEGLRLTKSFEVDVMVTLRPDGRFQASETPRKIIRQDHHAEGVITSSLYGAGTKAGVPAAILAKLIQAYSWEVDFQREIRKGDRFELFYEVYKDEDGKVIKSGEIRFATLWLSDKPTTIYRHELADGSIDYFNEKGHSAKRALMRTPIDGARLSSNYGRRKHPILGYTKMHRGVDFAAPRGTPIYAAGDGVVERANRWSSFGNYIRIRHNATYSTAYAHLKGFARGVRKGARVRQGQVIGYVGTTGRSTGPHLHYEIMRNGKHVNPMRVKMPSGRKLTGKALVAFEAHRTKMDRKVASLRAAKRLVTASKP